jgi:hypothetical protein
VSATKPVPDLEVKDATGEWPLVRGQLVVSKQRGIKGEIIDIYREVDGPHAGRVIVEVADSRKRYARLAQPFELEVKKRRRR